MPQEAPPPPPLPGMPPQVPRADPDQTQPSGQWPELYGGDSESDNRLHDYSPPPQPPRRAPAAIIVLSTLLAVSIVASVTLGARLASVNKQLANLREEVRAAATATPTASAAQPSSPSSVTFATPAITKIAHAVEQLRGLHFKTAVKTEVLTPDALRKRVETEFGKDVPRSEIDAASKTLKTLGVLSPSDDLYQIEFGIQTEQIAGYYDRKTKNLVVAGNADNLAPFDRVLMAHELTHALTDQVFGLGPYDKLQDEHKDDEAEAYLALIEGDATLMMFLYRQEMLTPAEQKQMDDEAAKQASPKLDAAPAILKRDLLFPYDDGVKFVQTLYTRGGTAAIDDAYRHPPDSTEQIMHPQKYFNRDAPQLVPVPDLASRLGAGWKQIDAGGVGELDVQAFADQYLPAQDASTAAQGWDGGRYVTLDSSKGPLIAVSTLWDDGDETREAADAFGQWLRPRFGDKGSAFTSPGVFGWESPNGAGEVIRKGTAMILILGPDRDSVTKAAQAF